MLIAKPANKPNPSVPSMLIAKPPIRKPNPNIPSMLIAKPPTKPNPNFVQTNSKSKHICLDCMT